MSANDDDVSSLIGSPVGRGGVRCLNCKQPVGETDSVRFPKGRVCRQCYGFADSALIRAWGYVGR